MFLCRKGFVGGHGLASPGTGVAAKLGSVVHAQPCIALTSMAARVCSIQRASYSMVNYQQKTECFDRKQIDAVSKCDIQIYCKLRLTESDLTGRHFCISPRMRCCTLQLLDAHFVESGLFVIIHCPLADEVFSSFHAVELTHSRQININRLLGSTWQCTIIHNSACRLF